VADLQQVKSLNGLYSLSSYAMPFMYSDSFQDDDELCNILTAIWLRNRSLAPAITISGQPCIAQPGTEYNIKHQSPNVGNYSRLPCLNPCPKQPCVSQVETVPGPKHQSLTIGDCSCLTWPSSIPCNPAGQHHLQCIFREVNRVEGDLVC
jgi:hypothetical protein